MREPHDPREPTAHLRSGLLVFLAAYVLVFLQYTVMQTPQLPTADALGYVRLADNLIRQDTLAIAAESNEPSRFFPPLYPHFLAAIAKVDSTFSDALACIGSKSYQGNCPADYGSALYFQFALSAITLTVIWFAGTLLFHSRLLAGIALICAWTTGRFGLYSGLFLTENLFIPCFSAAAFFLALGVRQERVRHYLLCGLMLGLAALTRPSAQYALYVTVIALVVIGAWTLLRQRKSHFLIGAVAIACAYVITISPWLMRNHSTFGRAFLTEGYASFILVERTAYNDMTWNEFGVALLYWLPWPGEQIATAVFEESEYRKLTFNAPDGYYIKGITQDKTALRSRFETEHARLAYLYENKIFNNPVKHTAVTLLLAYRGVWIVKYWALVAVPALLFLIWRSLARRERRDFIAFSLPALFMLFLHAAVSVNVHRYNLILIPGLAIATSWLFLVCASRFGLPPLLQKYLDGFRP